MLNVLDEHKEIDILTGLYFRRGGNFTPVIYSKLEADEKGLVTFEDYDGIPEELCEVAGCGFGCVLMRTDCLLDIAAKEGGGVWFTPILGAGEDCAFCIRARQNGFKIYCDPSIDLGHMAYAPVTKDFYKAMKENK